MLHGQLRLDSSQEGQSDGWTDSPFTSYSLHWYGRIVDAGAVSMHVRSPGFCVCLLLPSTMAVRASTHEMGSYSVHT